MFWTEGDRFDWSRRRHVQKESVCPDIRPALIVAGVHKARHPFLRRGFARRDRRRGKTLDGHRPAELSIASEVQDCIHRLDHASIKRLRLDLWIKSLCNLTNIGPAEIGNLLVAAKRLQDGSEIAPFAAFRHVGKGYLFERRLSFRSIDGFSQFTTLNFGRQVFGEFSVASAKAASNAFTGNCAVDVEDSTDSIRLELEGHNCVAFMSFWISD